MPFYYTYIVEEIFMLSIPMHIFHTLIALTCTDNLLQIIITVLIMAAWDIYFLSEYLLDSEGMYEQRHNIIIFFNVYMINATVWGIIVQNGRKMMFLQALKLKSINEEYLDILQYIPEGIMIA